MSELLILHEHSTGINYI